MTTLVRKWRSPEEDLWDRLRLGGALVGPNCFPRTLDHPKSPAAFAVEPCHTLDRLDQSLPPQALDEFLHIIPCLVR